MHPAVAKATQIGRIGEEHGWKGHLESEVVAHERVTVLMLTRNDESISVRWLGPRFSNAGYSIFNRFKGLDCSKHVIKQLQTWPDIGDLFKWFPRANRPNLVERYRRLPFDWENDDEDTIMSNLIGRQIFWYCHTSQKMQCDVVLLPKGNKAKHFRIQPVGHRKLFNFVGAQMGFRSVLLDTLIKVA